MAAMLGCRGTVPRGNEESTCASEFLVTASTGFTYRLEEHTSFYLCFFMLQF
jgi:hypothetical protein